MNPEITLLNGQPIPKDVKELATDDATGAVNTAVVAFLDTSYVRKAEQDTLIRARPPVDFEADTLIEKAPE